VRPLAARVTGVRCGASELARAQPGGLVALSTDLCPCLCAKDRLVGSVCGPPGTLPPVWRVLEVRNLRSARAQAGEAPALAPEGAPAPEPAPVSEPASGPQPCDLRAGQRVRVHVGTAVATGTVARTHRAKGKATVRLDAAVCAPRGADVLLSLSAKAGAREEEGAGGRVGAVAAAAGTLAGGVECEVVPAPEFEGLSCAAEEASADEAGFAADAALVEASAPADEAAAAGEEAWRARAVARLMQLREESGDGASRTPLAIPPIATVRDGGARACWPAFGATAAALGRPPEHLAAFLARHLQCARAGDGGGALRVRWVGRNLDRRLAELLRAYVRACVRCAECKGCRTSLARGSGSGALRGARMEVACEECGARRFASAE